MAFCIRAPENSSLNSGVGQSVAVQLLWNIKAQNKGNCKKVSYYWST